MSIIKFKNSTQTREKIYKERIRADKEKLKSFREGFRKAFEVAKHKSDMWPTINLDEAETPLYNDYNNFLRYSREMYKQIIEMADELSDAQKEVASYAGISLPKEQKQKVADQGDFQNNTKTSVDKSDTVMKELEEQKADYRGDNLASYANALESENKVLRLCLASAHKETSWALTMLAIGIVAIIFLLVL